VEDETFNIIKLFRKKKKFNVDSSISFCTFDYCFYFFAYRTSNKAVKVDYDRKLAKEQLYLKSEVDFFKTLRCGQFDDPQVFCIAVSDSQTDIYVFNNKSSPDEKTSDMFYSSYIIQFKSGKEP
jgi:hypothetical protein